MRLHSIVVALTAILAATAGARDSHAHDELGPLRAPPLQTDELLRRVRSFVATHWQQHRPGRVTYTLHAPPDEPLRGEVRVYRARDGTWRIRGSSHTVRSGRRVHKFEAVSLHYYGRYLYFRDHTGETVAML